MEALTWVFDVGISGNRAQVTMEFDAMLFGFRTGEGRWSRPARGTHMIAGSKIGQREAFEWQSD